MKKIFSSFLAISSVLLLMLTSCKKDENKEYSSIGNAGALTASTTAPALSKDIAANTAVTFNWAATPVNGTAGTVTYTLQVDKKGNNFKLPREIAASGTTTAVDVQTLNLALLNLGLPDSVATQVEVRLRSSIAPNIESAYSNTITLNVTPYSMISYLYVPGGYQEWSPAAAPELVSPVSNGQYDGTVEVSANTTDFGFKFTAQKDWGPKAYGGGSGKLDEAGGNLTFPGPGIYKIHVDLNTMSYTLTKQ